MYIQTDQIKYILDKEDNRVYIINITITQNNLYLYSFKVFNLLNLEIINQI